MNRSLIAFLGIFGSTLLGGTKEARFWQWFESNEAQLYSFESSPKRTLNDLSLALKNVDPDLTFELGPIQTDRRREFVLSAGGIRRAFPAVESLYSAAPELARWIVVKFRPRREPLCDLSISERTVKSSDVHYFLSKSENPKTVDIVLFFDGLKEGEEAIFGQIGFLFLDQALGEYDVETKVGSISFLSRESEYFVNAHPLGGLAKEFDMHFRDNEK